MIKKLSAYTTQEQSQLSREDLLKAIQLERESAELLDSFKSKGISKTVAGELVIRVDDKHFPITGGPKFWKTLQSRIPAILQAAEMLGAVDATPEERKAAKAKAAGAE